MPEDGTLHSLRFQIIKVTVPEEPVFQQVFARLSIFLFSTAMWWVAEEISSKQSWISHTLLGFRFRIEHWLYSSNLSMVHGELETLRLGTLSARDKTDKAVSLRFDLRSGGSGRDYTLISSIPWKMAVSFLRSAYSLLRRWTIDVDSCWTMLVGIYTA